jgi:hypothetical protein
MPHKPSLEFVRQKEVGREFEMAVMNVLRETPGVRVIDVDHWGYKHKKGRDIIIEVKGERGSLELKYDKMSELTKKVCIDWDSLNKTQSRYWLFGLPEGDKIAVYAMYSSRLRDFALQYAREHPESMKRVGEFKQYCVMIPKYIFTSQPFVFKFKTINLG